MCLSRTNLQALNARNHFDQRDAFKKNITSPEDLMEYLGCNENGQSFKGLAGDKGVGTFGGSEDHTAIMSCTSGNLHLYSYCPTVAEAVVSCPPDMVFVVAVSGNIAEKTGEYECCLVLLLLLNCEISTDQTLPILLNFIESILSYVSCFNCHHFHHFSGDKMKDYNDAALLAKEAARA